MKTNDLQSVIEHLESTANSASGFAIHLGWRGGSNVIGTDFTDKMWE